MKKLLILAVLGCFLGMLDSCQSLEDASAKKEENSANQENPVAGTSWEWADEYVKWTFTFTDTEVIFNYEHVDSPNSAEEYKSTYDYADGKVYFTMNGWSGIVWEYTGTISGDTMTLTDEGTEKMNLELTKK